MPRLTPNQVHVDQPLTNLTVAYLQSTAGFVADRVFPTVPVQYKSDKYYIYDRENFNRTGNVKLLAPGVETEEVGMSLSTDTYSIDVRGLGTSLDFQTLANEDAVLDIRRAKAEMLTMQLMIDRERRWADAFFSAGIWDTEYTGVASSPGANEVIQWSDYENSTPIIDVTNAKTAQQLASGGFRPNVMVVTQDVYDVLKNHPDLIERFNGGATTATPAMNDRDMMARIFEVDRFLVTDAIQNTAKAGLDEDNSFINSKKVALYYSPPAPGMMVPAAGYIFTWADLENAGGYGIEIRSYTDDALARQHIAEKMEAVVSDDMKVVGSEMGTFFADIIE